MNISYLLPNVKKMVLGKNYLILKGVLRAKIFGVEQKYIEPLIDSTKECFGNSVKFEKSLSQNNNIPCSMEIGLSGNKIKDFEIEKIRSKEGYILSVTTGGIKIISKSPVGLYYGIQTLKQINAKDKRLRVLTIYDWPDMEMRAVHCYKPEVYSLDFLKEWLKEMSAYKINTFFLELWRGCFKFERHPTINRGGVMDAEEIRELVMFAERHFIEIIPRINSFGHANYILDSEQYKDIRDAGDKTQLCTCNRKTFKLLEELYDEIIPLFPSKYIHLVCDETYQLGRCPKCREIVVKEGIAGLYAKHITQLYDILRKRNKQMLITADYILRYPETLNKIPKDIILDDWHYWPDYPPLYPSVDMLKKAGYPVIVGPAAACTEFIPHFKEHIENIRDIIYEGKKAKVCGEMTRIFGWIEDSFYPLLASAYFSWGDGPIANYDKTFCKNFFGIESSSRIENYLIKRYEELSRLHLLDLSLRGHEILNLSLTAKTVKLINNKLKECKFIIEILEKSLKKIKRNKSAYKFLVLNYKRLSLELQKYIFISRFKKLTLAQKDRALHKLKDAVDRIKVGCEKLYKDTRRGRKELPYFDETIYDYPKIYGNEVKSVKSLLTKRNYIPAITKEDGKIKPQAYSLNNAKIYGGVDRKARLTTLYDKESETFIFDESHVMDEGFYYNQRIFPLKEPYNGENFRMISSHHNKKETAITFERKVLAGNLMQEKTFILRKEERAITVKNIYKNLGEPAFVAIQTHPVIKIDYARMDAYKVYYKNKKDVKEMFLYQIPPMGRLITADGVVEVIDLNRNIKIRSIFNPQDCKHIFLCFDGDRLSIEHWGKKKYLQRDEKVALEVTWTIENI